ncbi:hypothetical protein HMPREF9628_01462 [Peptoanaerobacter stomatis]|uniref:Lipid II isoglutaminyl synthase (glutamine-hydrolyzing) subunit MurT n=1 Tax=Peptoanaerobacter stomatis TaxID=796937 RepID=G9XBU5_9FIRM|nr:Mur ligase family protein [Peptoanaerobacter stomatis]EHL19585.1 hypothetical protein HMPREF9628_01462 [Peptoanaerobacter stomatis]
MRYFALILGKIIFFLLKIFGRSGGSLPGKTAIRFCPDMLSYFKYPKITILVTGTNGKTSTSNIIANIFKRAGYKTVSNSKGDNIINGITSLLIKNSNFTFEIMADALIIEVDELTLAKQLKNIKASDIVITNFFRDQLDRAGEMESIILKISKAMENYKGRLFLNEDDPNVKRFSKISKDIKIVSFGLGKEKNAKTENFDAKEGKFCPICNGILEYEYYQYSHIGKYHCKNCDFKSDMPNYLAKDINYEDNTFEVEVIANSEKEFDEIPNKKIEKYKTSINATYHIYNLVSALAVGKTYGISSDDINTVFKNFNLGIGRMEKINIGDKKILLNLVKNPTGCNEIIKYIGNNKNEKALIFLLNDNHADGRDISWIWDVNFEQINNLKYAIITGKRAYEAAVRFKLSNISENIAVEKDIDKAIAKMLDTNMDMYVISTYTGLFDIRKKLLDFKA